MPGDTVVHVERTSGDLSAARFDLLAVFFTAMRDVGPLPRALVGLDQMLGGGVGELRHVTSSRSAHLPEMRWVRTRNDDGIFVGVLGLRGLVTLHDYIRAGAALARHVAVTKVRTVGVALVEADTTVLGSTGGAVESAFVSGFKQELFVGGAAVERVVLTVFEDDDGNREHVRAPRVREPA